MPPRAGMPSWSRSLGRDGLSLKPIEQLIFKRGLELATYS
jgi:hypothetical protein